MTTTATLSSPRLASWTAGSLVRAAGVAAGLALVANLVLLGVASLAGAVPAGSPQLAPGPVAAASIVGALAGIGVYAVVTRFLGRGLRTFQVVAAAFLVLSLGGPLSIPGNPAAAAATMVLMHVVTFGVVLAAAGAHARSAPARA